MATNSDEGTPITDSTKSILTGQDLLSRLSSLPGRLSQYRILHQLQYDQSLLISMIRLLEDKNQAIDIIELVWDIDRNLAARLAGATNSQIQREIVGRLRELIDLDLAIGYYGINFKVKLLAKIASEWVIPDLISVLDRSEYYSAALALKRIASQKHLGTVAILAEDGLVQCLEHPNSYVRSVAADVLGHLSSYCAVPLLIKNLQEHPDCWVRAKTATSLGKIGDGAEKTLDALLMALADPQCGVREFAAEALGLLKNDRAIEPLIVLLGDKHDSVRSSAAIALSQLGSDRAIESLIQLLKNSNPQVLATVAIALGKIGSDLAVEPLIQALAYQHPWSWEMISKALCAISNDRAVEAFESLLRDKSIYARQAAIDGLVGLRSKKSIQSLFDAFDSGDRDLCDRIALVLTGELGKQNIDLSIAILQNGFARARGRAAEILGQIGDQKAIEPLISALQDENAWVRKKAIHSLAKIAGEQEIERFVEALTDRDRDVRQNACTALGFTHRIEAIEPLILALQDPSNRVRASAAKSLGEIDSRLAVEQLAISLQDPIDWVKLSVAKTLGKIHGTMDTKHLTDDLRTQYFRSAMKKIHRISRVSSKNTKEYSCDISSKSMLENESISVFKLVSSLDSRDYREQDNAVKLLGKVGTEIALEPLLLFLNDLDRYENYWSAIDSLDKITHRLDRNTLLSRRDLIVNGLTITTKGNCSLRDREQAQALLEKINSMS